jgi:hypothetical protein
VASGLAPAHADDLIALFAGWGLIEPGVTPIELWRADTDEMSADRDLGTDVGGVGRKP